MSEQQPLVSIVIPTRNSSRFLDACLKSIRNQSHKNIEILLIDGNSTDGTIDIAKKYNATVLQFDPKLPRGTFDAPQRRNYGARKSVGMYVYYVDADMELTEGVLESAVKKCELGLDAVIVPEESFGIGVWASAKNLERKCYIGDDSIEAPRFIRRSVWDKVGGIDETVGGGGDDWDLYQKLLENGHGVVRVSNLVMHNEGNLKLSHLARKRFMYGKESLKYLSKRPMAGIKSYFPIRKAYIKNWKLFLKRPLDTFFFIIMRTTEYFAGFLGIINAKLSIKK